MSIEKTKANDVVASGLIAGARPTDGMTALGYFTLECYDKDGNLKWKAENHNLVVNVGLQYMCSTGLTNGTQITDRKSTRLNSSHSQQSRMPSSA